MRPHPFADDRAFRARGIEVLLTLLLFLACSRSFAQSTVQFSTTTYTVTEDAAIATLSVRRFNNLDLAITVDYTTTDGTAKAGLDYTAASGSINFAPWQTNQVLTVPILNDGLVEGIESLSVLLSNPTGGAALGSPHIATVHINDNDQGLQFEFGSSTFGNYKVGENEDCIVLAVVRGDDGDFPVSVDYYTTDATALSGLDYLGATNTLFFERGQRIAVMTIPILHDAIKEVGETFRVTLTHPTNQVLGGQKIATITILDNDGGAQFQPYGTYRIPENAAFVTLTVVRGNDGNLAPFTLDFATSDLTATDGLDYVGSSGTLTFSQGEMTRTLTVPILYDENPEIDEQFKVTLSNPTGGAVLGSLTAATVTILDITNAALHQMDGVSIRQDRSVQIQLRGGVDGHFRDYFDLYPIEISSNLVDWIPLVTLQRTNASTNVLTYVDPAAPGRDRRFYRVPTNHLITPWAQPSGPFQPGVVSRQLTDPARRNRYGRSTNCSFMASIWYPAVAEAGRLPGRFMDLQMAADPTWMGVFSVSDFTARMPFLVSHALPNAPCATAEAPFPILLDSHGWGGFRTGSALGPELASHGYVVVGVDHYDAIRTVFPDGTYLQGDIGSGNGASGTQDRVQDLVYILDEMTRWNTSDPFFAGRLDLTRISAIGGSWGGVTVAEFGRVDARCKAVIGLDPMPFGSAPQLVRVAQPVLEINASNNGDATLYDMSSASATWFQISNTDHLMIAGFGLYWAWQPANIASGREVARTINAYVLWFLNKHMKGANDAMPAPARHPRAVFFKQK